MMKLYDLFNVKFSEFLDDLISIASEYEKADLVAMRDILNWTIQVMGNKVPQEMFHSCVIEPYGDKIINKNEAFFLEECPYDTRYADINIINKLKNKWKTLNSENKETVWKYLQVLMALNNKIMHV